MASLFEEYHKQAHEQSAQFGFEATCKTPVQPAQSNIEQSYHVHTTTYAKVCSLKYHAQVCNAVTQFLSIDFQALDIEKKRQVR